jgi:hypothetical protein
MNLEDRLRSHMHSGEDQFIENGRDAGAIVTAGHRRNRRNQIGGAAAGGVLALGLVFGVASSIGDDVGPRELATEELPTEELPTEDFAGASEEAEVAESGLAQDPTDSAIFDGSAAQFEIVTGVGDGFAGLRSTAGLITAIRSDDGLTWTEVPTTGITTELFGQLIHSEGTFAAIFTTFDENIGVERTFIGTSTDLVAWGLVEVLPDAPDVFLGGLAIKDGQLVSVAQSFSQSEDEADLDVTLLSITGPVGGPYETVPIPNVNFGIDRIVPTNTGFAMTVFTDGPAQTLSSVDGRLWTLAEIARSAQHYSTIASTDSALLSLTGVDLGGSSSLSVRESSDGGFTWDEVALPSSAANRRWWSFDVDTEDDTAAMLLQGPGGDEFTTVYGLVATSGGPWSSINLSPHVEHGATAILAAVSSDEVLLQIFAPPIGELDEDLAASSGVADEPGLASTEIQYVRVPLT